MRPSHFLLPAVAAAAGPGPGPVSPDPSWIGYGGNSLNNRWASTNALINSSTIPSAEVTCRIPFAGGMSTTPSIVGPLAYFPTWNGSLVALDYTTCTIKWSINVTALVTSFGPSSPIQQALQPAISRTTPQIDVAKNLLYFGSFRFALVFAAELSTGKILATRQIHKHHLAQITQSPTLHSQTNTLYLGVASSEESIVSFDPNHANTTNTPYTFIGTAVALRYSPSRREFTLLWERQTLPEDDQRPGSPGRWSGAGIWGSQPSIDLARNQVYYATGNVYSVPDAYLPCTADPTVCSIPSRVWQNSVIAFDLSTGRANWVRQLGPIDSWTVACTIPPINTDLCIGTPGPDADFGMAPVFVPRSQQETSDRGKEDLVVVGQKNGDVHALSAATGRVKWSTKAGPEATGGGVVWGVAVDSSRVYFNEANAGNQEWKPGPAPAPGEPDTRVTTKGGAHSAIDLQTGRIVWQTAAAENFSASNPPTVVGDLVVMGRQNYLTPEGGFLPEGSLVILRKDTGVVVKELELDGYHLASVAVAGRYLMFGTGHHAGFDGSFWVVRV